ncbi:condensation domain-containing protein [Streptomyces sp. 900105755]
MELSLTPQQTRLWQVEKSEGKLLVVFRVDRTLPLGGPVHPRELSRAFIARHEALRSSVAVRDGVPVIVVDPPELSDLYLHEPQGRAPQPVPTMPGQVAATVLEYVEGQALLSFRIHHIMQDFWGTGALAADFDAFAADTAIRAPKQPSEYASPEAQAVYEANFAKERRELGRRYRPIPSPRSRPDHEPAGIFRDAELLKLALPRTVADIVAQAKSVHRATDFVVWHAAVGLTLSRYLGLSHMLVHSVTANRPTKTDAAVVGCLSGISLFDISPPPGDARVPAYLNGLAKEMMRVFLHSPYDDSRMVEALRRSAPPDAYPCVAGTNVMYPVSPADYVPRGVPSPAEEDMAVIRRQSGVSQPEHLRLTLGGSREALVVEVVTSSVLPGPERVMREILEALRFVAERPGGRVAEFAGSPMTGSSRHGAGDGNRLRSDTEGPTPR